MAKLKDSEHLLRLAGVFVVAILLFLFMRTMFVPKSFGRYGYYRAEALTDITARTVAYAGHKACADCHDDIVQAKSTGKHVNVNCEACHGALQKHVEDPASVVPQLPDTGVLCARCHEANLAKPRNFPQVASKDHSGDAKCKTCHQPHNPLLQPGGGK